MRPRLADLFKGTGVLTEESSLGEAGEPLYPEELAEIRACVERRRREFAAGRLCSRRALAVLGISNFPLLPGADRAPIWPPGLVGSITHTEVGADGYCGVAIADRSHASGLGIDAEPSLPLPADLWPLILDATEHEAAISSDEPGIQARLVFSAKEATYKALYPGTRRFLEFSDLHIDVDIREGIFLATLVGQATSLMAEHPRLVGRLAVDQELILTAMVLPPSRLPLAQECLSRHDIPC